MVQRVLTALVGLVIFFAVLFSDEIVFSIAVAIVALMSLYEIYKSMSVGKSVKVWGFVSAIIVFLGSFLNVLEPALVVSVMIYMIAGVYLHGKYDYKEIYSAAFITYFVAIFYSSLMRLRLNFGTEAVFMVFIFGWVTDTGAYFSGRFFGKHKLMPRVSPKKTVEGAIGGVICTVVFSVLYLLLLRKGFSIDTVGGAGYIGMSIIALIVSVLAQFGDLTASALKRDCGVKDFGSLLPGHGGVMDRFDSVVFIAPVVYYFFLYFDKFVM